MANGKGCRQLEETAVLPSIPTHSWFAFLGIQSSKLAKGRTYCIHEFGSVFNTLTLDILTYCILYYFIYLLISKLSTWKIINTKSKRKNRKEKWKEWKKNRQIFLVHFVSNNFIKVSNFSIWSKIFSDKNMWKNITTVLMHNIFKEFFTHFKQKILLYVTDSF